MKEKDFHFEQMKGHRCLSVPGCNGKTSRLLLVSSFKLQQACESPSFMSKPLQYFIFLHPNILGEMQGFSPARSDIRLTLSVCF
jgi:hypothetical protein